VAGAVSAAELVHCTAFGNYQTALQSFSQCSRYKRYNWNDACSAVEHVQQSISRLAHLLNPVYPAMLCNSAQSSSLGSLGCLNRGGQVEVLQTNERDDAYDDEDWGPQGCAAALAAEKETRSKYLPDANPCERIRDLAVQLCMLACGDSFCLALFRCSSKAVELYDDIEVREVVSFVLLVR
jgi:hypothetical protein